MLASVTESDLKNIINIEKYSSTYRLFRVTGYFQRFITNSKVGLQTSIVVREIELTVKVLQNARDLWILNEQKILYLIKSI